MHDLIQTFKVCEISLDDTPRKKKRAKIISVGKEREIQIRRLELWTIEKQSDCRDLINLRAWKLKEACPFANSHK